MTTQQIPTTSKTVTLRWTGTGREYRGGTADGTPLALNGGPGPEPGPMDALLLSLAGCMAVDLQVILERSRVPLVGLEVEVEGERAPEHPKRYTRIRLCFRLEGPQEGHQAKVARAVQLSREKFCSVLYSLRQDIEFEFEVRTA